MISNPAVSHVSVGSTSFFKDLRVLLYKVLLLNILLFFYLGLHLQPGGLQHSRNFFIYITITFAPLLCLTVSRLVYLPGLATLLYRTKFCRTDDAAAAELLFSKSSSSYSSIPALHLSSYSRDPLQGTHPISVPLLYL